MEYLFLAYQTSEAQGGPSDATHRLIAEACRDNNLVLRESGYLVLNASLPHSTPVATVSLQNGEVSVGTTATPLVGLYLIHAKDMNDAIRIAGNMPQARLGTIEIWAVSSVDAV